MEKLLIKMEKLLFKNIYLKMQKTFITLHFFYINISNTKLYI
jgi:hypothetical protein